MSETELLIDAAKSEFKEAITHLSRASNLLSDTKKFEGTVEQVKETIGDLTCSIQAIVDMENF